VLQKGLQIQVHTDMENKNQVVLSVDDNDVDGALLERAFKRCNIPSRLFRVAEGPQAMAYLTGHGIYSDRFAYPLPDLILLDLVMPKMSGFEVLEWIRSQPELKRTAVLILTASEKPEDVKSATKTGANGYLVKPTKFEDLKTMVRTIYSEWLDKGKKGKASSARKAKGEEPNGSPALANGEEPAAGMTAAPVTSPVKESASVGVAGAVGV
jgi:CheY-like chemotaxis protein